MQHSLCFHLRIAYIPPLRLKTVTRQISSNAAVTAKAMIILAITFVPVELLFALSSF